MLFFFLDFKCKYFLCFFFHKNAKALELPYQNRSASMIFFLPNEKDGLPELEEKVSKFNFGKIRQYLNELCLTHYMCVVLLKLRPYLSLVKNLLKK